MVNLVQHSTFHDLNNNTDSRMAVRLQSVVSRQQQQCGVSVAKAHANPDYVCVGKTRVNMGQ
jgi:hypothetical protein